MAGRSSAASINSYTPVDFEVNRYTLLFISLTEMLRMVTSRSE
jgi:hypothetical protein